MDMFYKKQKDKLILRRDGAGKHATSIPKGGFSWLLVATISLMLFSPSMASNSKPSTQSPLSIKPSFEKWEDCGELNNHTLECIVINPRLTIKLTKKGARIDVPMDHFNKVSEKTFSIPLIRMLAKNSSAKSILLNPGGPGGMPPFQL